MDRYTADRIAAGHGRCNNAGLVHESLPWLTIDLLFNGDPPTVLALLHEARKRAGIASPAVCMAYLLDLLASVSAGDEVISHVTLASAPERMGNGTYYLSPDLRIRRRTTSHDGVFHVAHLSPVGKARWRAMRSIFEAV